VQRDLLAVVHAAVALQPGAEAALRDCLDRSVAKEPELARRVGAVMSGYAFILGDLEQLPPSGLIEEVAGLVRYHRLLVATTAQHFFNTTTSTTAANADDRFTDQLGGPGLRLRRIDAALGVYAQRDAAPDERPEASDRSVRAPLTRILASASTLAQSDVHWNDDVWRRLIATINNESVRLAQILDNVLCLSLLEAGRLEPSLDYCDPAALVRAAVNRVDPALRLGERIVVSVSAVVEPAVRLLWADPRLTLQVVTEALDNAARHAGPEAEIILSVRAAVRDVEILVEDNGVGLPLAVRRCLLPDVCSTTLPGGTGIRTIIGLTNSMGGDVEYPPAHQGTRCRLRLPRSD
jgi:signal transduction histidine kinase